MSQLHNVGLKNWRSFCAIHQILQSFLNTWIICHLIHLSSNVVNPNAGSRSSFDLFFRHLTNLVGRLCTLSRHSMCFTKYGEYSRRVSHMFYICILPIEIQSCKSLQNTWVSYHPHYPHGFGCCSHWNAAGFKSFAVCTPRTFPSFVLLPAGPISLSLFNEWRTCMVLHWLPLLWPIADSVEVIL